MVLNYCSTLIINEILAVLKFLDIANNELKCGDYFILFHICAGDDDQQINYGWVS